jgi:carboxymethylenebutenolidase
MIITTEYVETDVDGAALRMFVARPNASGKYPGVIFYSDIFQLTGPMLRATMRLAGYGFVVAAPEIYHRIEPPGTVIPFDDEGRTRGMDDAARTTVADFDRTCRAVLDYLAAHPQVAQSLLGAAGFCIGGHLAFRAALQADVLATTCFYPTGLHTGKLGKDADAGSLERSKEIKGELLLVFGAKDPHVPEEGRAKLVMVLAEARTRFQLRLYPAEHAFMRDEGARYDPAATDAAFADMIALFRNAFSS